MKMVFSKDYLRDELDLPSSALVDDIIDNSRWSIHHKIVFEDKGKFYQTYYSEGATEMQDESPWEYDDDVECTEVELRDVKVKKWIPVKDK